MADNIAHHPSSSTSAPQSSLPLSSLSGRSLLSGGLTCPATDFGQTVTSISTQRNTDTQKLFEASKERLVPIRIWERLIGGKVKEGYLRIVQDEKYQKLSVDIVIRDPASGVLAVLDFSENQNAEVRFMEPGAWELYAAVVPPGLRKSSYSVWERDQKEFVKWGIPIGLLLVPFVLAGANIMRNDPDDPFNGNLETMLREAVERKKARSAGEMPNKKADEADSGAGAGDAHVLD